MSGVVDSFTKLSNLNNNDSQNCLGLADNLSKWYPKIKQVFGDKTNPMINEMARAFSELVSNPNPFLLNDFGIYNVGLDVVRGPDGTIIGYNPIFNSPSVGNTIGYAGEPAMCLFAKSIQSTFPTYSYPNQAA
ncbi:hypothetical protein A0H76_69 [Hepatospora eriocheir]|uniref:Uncharacterized protein n=1 Tax=Hepatospora eriocheir TaxID=1081669 RepID=A0A1X0QEQ4_9MICR|nr:hypothetical protein A0H76_69 [Hepatospora eriocheir]